MANFCAIRPANDAASLELSIWCAALLPAIAGSNHTVATDLYASAAVRRAVERAFANIRCVLFFGHGTETELLGARDAALVDGLNIAQARGAIFISIACSSASVLGRNAIENGVESYLGFSGPFAWVARDPDNRFQPATCRGILGMLEGMTTGAATQTMGEAFTEVVDFYLSGAGQGTTNSAFGYLTAFWDRQHLLLLGNRNAVL
jgi:hypothetical protein